MLRGFCVSLGGDYIRLTDKHLSSLYHQLENYAHKWSDIALYLGFLPGEVNNIEASLRLMHGAPKTYLRALFIEWLQWAPGDSRGSGDFATLQSLKTALNKVGLGAAAHDLKSESDEATAMGLGLHHVRTVRQPSVLTPCTYPQTPVTPHPLNPVYRLPSNRFYHPPYYGRKCTVYVPEKPIYNIEIFSTLIICI